LDTSEIRGASCRSRGRSVAGDDRIVIICHFELDTAMRRAHRALFNAVQKCGVKNSIQQGFYRNPPQVQSTSNYGTWLTAEVIVARARICSHSCWSSPHRHTRPDRLPCACENPSLPYIIAASRGGGSAALVSPDKPRVSTAHCPGGSRWSHADSHTRLASRVDALGALAALHLCIEGSERHSALRTRQARTWEKQ